MTTDHYRACGRCGADPAAGSASINDVWFCHEGDSPTCYEIATRTEARRLAREVEDQAGDQLDLPPAAVMQEILGQHAANPTVQRWVSEFRHFMRERETWHPDMDAPFWLRLGVRGDLPVHMPIGVNKQGQGPTDPEPAHHYSCWCGEDECALAMALQHAWLAGRRSQDGLVEERQVRAVLRLISPEHITPTGKRQLEKVLDHD